MALPGTPGQRISDLCNGNHISQKQLAEKIGVSASQLNRIVSGETKTVSSDILIGVAKGIMARNQLIELATASLSDLMKEHQQELLSMDDVTAMIAGQIWKFLPMDEETAEQFRQLAKRMMEQVGK